MAFTIEIGGIDKTSIMKCESLRVTRRADHRHDCSLTVSTTAASYIPDVGVDLKIKQDGSVIFGGIIQTVTMRRPGVGTATSTTILIDITSDGYNSIPQRRTINTSVDNKTAEEIIDSCLVHLAGEGITKGTVDTGATFIEYDAVCKSIFEILNDMAEASGYKWYIDDNKALQFYQEDAIAAAEHTIVIGGAFTDYQITAVEKTLDEYANKIFLRGDIGDDGLIVTEIAQDATEQAARQTIEGGAGASSGVYGLVINDNNIDNDTDAAASAANELKKRCRIPMKITFTSWTLDWTAGKKLTVNLPIFGISSDAYFLVEEVTIEDIDGKNLMATITATQRNNDDFSTQRTQSGVDYFAKLANGINKQTSGTKIIKSIVKDFTAVNAAQVTVDDTEDTIVSKEIRIDVKSDVKIFFSCSGAASGALTITLKSYQDATARTYQPVLDIGGANDEIITFVDTIKGLAIGTYTIAIKAVTSANSFVIAANFATLNLLVVPDISALILTDPSGLTLTVISDDEIDLAWSNPPALYFDSVEVYRSESNLTSQNRAWCDANADLVYSGSNESYNNTGLDPETLYYYKVFAVYVNDSGTYYSSGISGSETTDEAAIPDYQQWASYPDSPVLTSSFPYQAIWYSPTAGVNYRIGLIASTHKIYKNSSTICGGGNTTNTKIYLMPVGGSNWGSANPFGFYQYAAGDMEMKEANYDVYEDSTLTTVYFAKTTP